MITQEEYLENSAHCLYCGSENTDAGSYEADGNEIHQDVRCKNCGGTWTDTYKLTCFSATKIPPVQLDAHWVVTTGTFGDDGRQQIRVANENDVLKGDAFIGLYQYNLMEGTLEWISDYEDEDELFRNTGISAVNLVGFGTYSRGGKTNG